MAAVEAQGESLRATARAVEDEYKRRTNRGGVVLIPCDPTEARAAAESYPPEECTEAPAPELLREPEDTCPPQAPSFEASAPFEKTRHASIATGTPAPDSPGGPGKFGRVSPAAPLLEALPPSGPAPCLPVVGEKDVPCCPWRQETIGENLTVSDGDLREVRRMRGCQHAVAVGCWPLPRGPQGWFFEIEILDVVSGWVGGVGIGVTQAPESVLSAGLPEKAWQLPKTFVVGYWGRCFCNGVEHRTTWKADSLEPGDRVGLLITLQGELHLWVNGDRKVRVDARIPVVPSEGWETAPRMLPVVDVFASTSAVRWVHGAEPPPTNPGGEGLAVFGPASPASHTSSTPWSDGATPSVTLSAVAVPSARGDEWTEAKELPAPAAARLAAAGLTQLGAKPSAKPLP